MMQPTETKKNDFLKQMMMRAAMTLFVVMMTLTAARAVTTVDGKWEYSLTTGGCCITGYSGSKEISDIIIPKTLDGHTVVRISSDVFSGCNQLSTIYFYSDASIENMPSVRNIASFEDVIVFDVENNNAYIHNRLPASIKEIGGETFKGTAITILTLPGVTSVGYDAFEGCDHLESVTFEKPATIAEGAFRKIPGNVKVTYKGPIENWNPYCYEYSPNLVVKCNDGSCGWCGDEFGERNSSNYYKEASCLYWKIDDHGNMTIDCLQQDIILDNYLSYQIIKTEHWDKVDVKTLTLNHVHVLYGSEFNNDMETGLKGYVFTSVVINDGLVEIGGYSFYCCESLKNVVLPSSLTTIGHSAFAWCTSLEDIYFEGTKTQWDNVIKAVSWNRNVPSTCKEHWRCTVTFDANGHGTAPAAQTNLWSNEAKVTKPADPSAEGWWFTGWYTDAACTTKWDFDTDVVPGDMTLYAGWAEILGSSYTMAVPEQVTITPNVEWTPMTIDVTELELHLMANGKTPQFLRTVFYAGTLTNQTDNSQTIPFQLSHSSGSGVFDNRLRDFTTVGSLYLYINIPADSWNVAPGTYTGSISYKAFWVFGAGDVSDNLETGSIPVTVTIPRPCTITTAVSPAEGGTVTGGGTYDEDTDVTLTATANKGYRFVNWTEDGNEVSTEATYTFTLGADRSLVANFERAYTISVMVDPDGSGTVTGGSSGTYALGTQLELKATPNEGYRFVNWTIDGINGGSDPTYPFIVRGDFSTVVAHFEPIYSLTGTNVDFYIDGDVVTEAAEGEQVTVCPNLDKLQDGYYLTGEYQSDDVEITKEDYSEDGCFTMPAKAVTVTAVTAPRTEYEIDLTAATEQVIDEEARMVLQQMEGYASSECDETTWDCVYYLDLNLDETPDLQLTENTDQETWVTTYGVTKLAGANQLTENYRLTIPTFSGLNPSRYSSILVKLVSGSGTHDLPQIIIGDVNGDGRVTITDAALLMDYLAHPDNAPAGFILQAADVDYSGDISPADAVEILKKILE